MGDYYNKTRGPVAVTLQRGGSMSLGPKTWGHIEPADEGTPSLAMALRKGLLLRSVIPVVEEVPVVALPEAPTTVLVPEAPIALPEVSLDLAAPESASTSASTDSKPSRRNK